MARILLRKIIYDFDDAIWLTDRKSEPAALRIAKWRSKVRHICRWSYAVSCGNEYLCDYARTFNNNVHLIPTTVDTEAWHNPALFGRKPTNDNRVTIGWTGSHSTLKYLIALEPVLKKIEEEFPAVTFIVIADKKPELNVRSIRFIPWNKSTEAADLTHMDIGIMPLPDDEWAKGKCGFKALQYMAMEIPTVVSSVGVNTSIVESGKNGLLADNEQEWITALKTLIEDTALRSRLGKAGRKKIIDQYSTTSVSSSFLSLFPKSIKSISPIK